MNLGLDFTDVLVFPSRFLFSFAQRRGAGLRTRASRLLEGTDVQQAWSMLEDFICSAESSEESLKLLSKVSAAATAFTQSLTVAQVCQMLSLSPRTVYELANVPIRVEEFMSDNGLIKRVLPTMSQLSCR